MKICRMFFVAMIAAALIQNGFGQDKKPSNSSSKPPSSNSSSKPPSNNSSKPPNNSTKPPNNNSSKPPSNSTKPPNNNSSKPPSSKQMEPKPPVAKTGPKSEQKPVNPPASNPKPKDDFKPENLKPSNIEQKTNPNPQPNTSNKPPNLSKKPPTSNEKSNPNPVASEKSNPNFATNPNTPPVNTNSKKPTPVAGTAKAEAAKQEASKRQYVESQKAKLPPKTEYKTPEGKTVNVKPDSVAAKTIRDKPSTYYRPEVRQQRTVEHIHHYHYQHPSSWYYSQPTIYVGGGYSSAFYWMMMEWDAERRAQWFYNHRNTIERDAYERGMRDAAVAARVAELQAQGARSNPDYVDPEFAKDPSMMYTQDHIEAVYNPEISNGNSVGIVFLIVCGSVVLCVTAYVVLFKIRWGK